MLVGYSSYLGSIWFSYNISTLSCMTFSVTLPVHFEVLVPSFVNQCWAWDDDDDVYCGVTVKSVLSAGREISAESVSGCIRL